MSFHREKFVQNGGPDGGDGGDGGNVVFVGDAGMHTLMDFRYKTKYESEAGGDGLSQNRTGKNGADVVIRVPLGTMIRERSTKTLLADIKFDGERRTILRGGRGGWGNTRFKTATRQAPNFAKPGEKSVWVELELELRLIADVGLVGMPNAGKSTLLSVVSTAKPKIANYPFTTLSPNIGMVRFGGGDFVLADLPGLIEGAAVGVGLGHAFLRHAERTRLLVHVVDMSGVEERDPIDDYRIIRNELARFSAINDSTLDKRVTIVVANKMDMPTSSENLARFRAAFPTVEVCPISAMTKDGVDTLLYKILHELPLAPIPEVEKEADGGAISSIAEATGFTVSCVDGQLSVVGPGMRRLIDTVNFSDLESVAWFHRSLEKLGVIDALRKAGAKQDDTIYIEEQEFNFVD